MLRVPQGSIFRPLSSTVFTPSLGDPGQSHGFKHQPYAECSQLKSPACHRFCTPNASPTSPGCLTSISNLVKSKNRLLISPHPKYAYPTGFPILVNWQLHPSNCPDQTHGIILDSTSFSLSPPTSNLLANPIGSTFKMYRNFEHVSTSPL